VNDGFGHLFGDEVLIHFSRILNDALRDNDLLFRYGGEEFAVILKDIGLADLSSTILQRLRKRVETYNFPQVGKVTISIGFVIIKQGEAPFIAIDKADRALYYAKRNGRNRVCSYDQLIEDGKLNTADYKKYDIKLY
jgi:diguanylate cyclase (GGDEF)-like protein